MKCCKNLDELEREYPDGPTHGASLVCDECGADYYEDYGGEIFATNKQGNLNHPELKTL